MYTIGKQYALVQQQEKCFLKKFKENTNFSEIVHSSKIQELGFGLTVVQTRKLAYNKLGETAERKQYALSLIHIY